jgi:hypothetical protein
LCTRISPPSSDTWHRPGAATSGADTDLERASANRLAGDTVTRHALSRGGTPGIHPWIADLEAKVIRGEAACHAALKMKQGGFSPKVIVAHPGWGESLFLKDIWPTTRLGIYCEFFYHAHGADVGFDPEFPVDEPAIAGRMRMKNSNTLLHFDIADAGISPTHWQASTFPKPFRRRSASSTTASIPRQQRRIRISA